MKTKTPISKAAFVCDWMEHSDNRFFMVIFFLATIVLCSPLLGNLGGHLGTLPEGDKGTNLWNLWWVFHAVFQEMQSPLRCDLIFHPWGCDLRFHTLSLANGILASPITWLFGASVAYNILFLSWTWLTGVAAAFWGRSLGLRRFGAVLIGFIAAFGPYRWHHLEHLNLFSTAWMFFAFYSFERWMDNHRWRYGILFTLTWILAGLSDWYYGLFIALYAVIRFLVASWEWRDWKTIFIRGAQCLLPVAAMSAVLWLYFSTPSSSSFKEVYVDPVGIKYSAYWSLDLLHLLFPPWLLRSLPGIDIPLRKEFILHPGIVLLWGAIVFFLWDWWKNRSRCWKRRGFLITSVFFLVLSLGPMLKVNDDVLMYSGIPFILPALIFEGIPSLTVLRVFSRFAYVGFLTLIALGLLGLESTILPSMNKWTKRLTFFCLILAFLLETTWKLPPVHSFDPHPERFEGDQETILLLPFTPSKRSGTHLYYQTFHHKPIYVVEFSRLGRYKQQYLTAFPILPYLNRVTLPLSDRDSIKIPKIDICEELYELGRCKIIFEGRFFSIKDQSKSVEDLRQIQNQCSLFPGEFWAYIVDKE